MKRQPISTLVFLVSAAAALLLLSSGRTGLGFGPGRSYIFDRGQLIASPADDAPAAAFHPSAVLYVLLALCFLALLVYLVVALIRAIVAAQAPGQLMVVPEVIKLRRITIRPRRTRIYAGTIPACQGGSGVEFFGVREYQPGDSTRWINGRATARHPEALFVNEFEQERVTDVGIILDARRQSDVHTAHGALFEHAVQAAAALADALRARRRAARARQPGRAAGLRRGARSGAARLRQRIERSIEPSKVAATGCGCFTLADTLIRFPDIDRSLKRPDLAIFCAEPPDSDEALELLPAAVVEVLSFGYEDKDLGPDGAPFYLDCGVADVLVVDPCSGHIRHYRPGQPVAELESPVTVALACGCRVQL